MIGNDVVDLRDAEVQPGATHRRFDERVFAEPERAAIERSGAPNRLRWMLWAAKKAAYKVARKLDPRVVFSPRRFTVELESDLHGSVCHGDWRFPVVIHEESQAVHAVAASSEQCLERVRAEMRLCPGDYAGGPSAAVRSVAIDHLARELGTESLDLTIVREGRVPRLMLRGEPSGLDLSLSHHGRLVAFACEFEGSGAGA